MPILNINIPDADETTKGIAEIATQAEVNAGTDDTKIVTPNKLENSAIRSEVTANNAKVTNATHTGQVTGSGALTVDKTAITDQSAGTVASGDLVLISDVDDTNNLKKVTAQSIADLGGGGGKSYCLTWVTNSFNPVDATRYWLPVYPAGGATGTNGNKRHQIPVDASEFTLNIGLASGGSTETSTWVIRNHTQSTEANFSPGHAFTASGQANAWYGTAGDYIEIILDTATWATNPTSLRINALLNFQAD